MKPSFLFVAMFAASVCPMPAAAEDVSARRAAVDNKTDAELEGLVKIYKHFHARPELSYQEVETAGRLAKELRAAGFEVTEKVGGTGIVGVLRNGKGPTVLVRADMDALPVAEQTGLPYASKVRMRDKAGNDVGVMHACGHDIHMTSLVGTARVLSAMKDRWSGTLVFIGQPGEEVGAGARAMIDDGLLKRFPRPDFALALHCDANYPHGHVSFREGLAQANADTVDIVVRGKGGHGAAPHTTVDPVVLAARIVLDLQTIVSRERSPTDPVVITVGSIHGGSKHNIIPNEVKLQLTVRTTNDRSRKAVLEAIERKAKAAAMGAGAPEPTVRADPGEFFLAMSNDTALTRRMLPVLQEVLGKGKVHERGMSMGSEDFSLFGRAGIPAFYYWIGTVAPERWAEAQRENGRPLPPTHSDQFYPIPEPTIRTGVVTMSMAVLNLVGK